MIVFGISDSFMCGASVVIDGKVVAAVNEERLDRNMSFAPVSLWEEREKCYTGIKGAEDTARFMTITFNCTDFMIKRCPAVCNVDNTARPQLIWKEDNPDNYSILIEYQAITGLPSLINTRFNMHGEPIVYTPDDAVRSFKSGNLDALAIGRYLVLAE